MALYCGIDLHSRDSWLAILRDDLEVVRETKVSNDVEAIADVLAAASRMALDLQDSLAELDINPLIVLPEGKGARVADALVIKK